MVLDRVSDTQTSAASAPQEVQHRVKNDLAMIAGLIRTGARTASADSDRFGKLARRIEALQLLYKEMITAGPRDDERDLGASLSRMAHAIGHLDGRPGLGVTVDVAAARLPVDIATRAGRILSEVMTNALQHAFVGRRHGHVHATLGAATGGELRLAVADDGVGLPEDRGC